MIVPLDIDIRIFQNFIISWFRENGRQFKWRESNLTPYEIIISEVLLQRTKAETISKFYSQFISQYPNWDSLMSVNIEDFEQFLQPLGLYKQRAERLKQLANVMVETKYYLPTERLLLEKIPMMGQYIANAVELLILKRNKPLLDVNMARVLERYFGPRKLKDIRYDPYLQSLAHRVVDHPKSKEINWAILDFAAKICQSRKPKCDICMFQSTCQYYLSINNFQPTYKRT
jgi:A/G-specific adenine glycosylase